MRLFRERSATIGALDRSAYATSRSPSFALAVCLSFVGHARGWSHDQCVAAIAATLASNLPVNSAETSLLLIYGYLNAYFICSSKISETCHEFNRNLILFNLIGLKIPNRFKYCKYNSKEAISPILIDLIELSLTHVSCMPIFGSVWFTIESFLRDFAL